MAALQAFDLRDRAGVIVMPRQSRLASSSTAQISDSAEVSPGSAR